MDFPTFFPFLSITYLTVSQIARQLPNPSLPPAARDSSLPVRSSALSARDRRSARILESRMRDQTSTHTEKAAEAVIG